MSEEYRYPNSVKSLDVVPPANPKVEQLRAEAHAEATTTGTTSANAHPEKKLNDRNVIDRAVEPNKTIQQKLLEGKVIEACRKVFDPEIPLNIYELGLIYDIHIDDDNKVTVKMTLTAPGCPVAGSLPMEVQTQIQKVPEVTDAEVILVWDPPWDKSRMSEAALLELGLL
jgi:FeS assembly SUF system protein